MKSETRFTVMDARDRGLVAALLRSKRKNAIPANNAQILQWEGEGGLTTSSELADMRAAPNSA